uniref:Uncharacterized protein n=1 Tax=Zooxanthella nutricula TaxID=1333877 RepID=A0A6U6PXE8_9DINO
MALSPPVAWRSPRADMEPAASVCFGPMLEAVAHQQSLKFVSPGRASRRLEAEGLLRGVTFADCARRWGALWRSSSCWLADGRSSDELAQAFQAPKAFSWFLSHSWRASGFSKWLTLQHRQIGGWRFLVVLTACNFAITSTAVALFAWLRLAYDCDSHEFSVHVCMLRDGPKADDAVDLAYSRFSLLLELATTLVFASLWLALMSYGHLLKFFDPTRDSAMYFLDKCSIRQNHASLKASGIRHLGEFLMASERMLVLYDSTYPTRLCCVFELAAFCWGRGGSNDVRIEVIGAVPAAYACAVVGLVISIIEVVPRSIAVHSGLDDYSVRFISTMAFAILMVLAPLLIWIVGFRSSRQFSDSLRDFQTQHAQCADASDKALIHQFISQAWGSAEEDGITAFDNFVADVLRTRIERQMRSCRDLCSLVGPMAVVAVNMEFLKASVRLVPVAMTER